MKDIKECRLCGEVKLASKENFPIRSDTGKFRTECKPCYNKWRRESPNYARVSLLRQARTRAKQRGVDFNLTLEDVTIPKECPVLNIPLIHGSKSWYNSPSIDRIDNNKYYIKGNVLIISVLANSIKNQATPDQIQKVATFYKKLYNERGITYGN